MAFTLDRIVPWGRSYAEYLKMFRLTEDDLKVRILCCADGPASFNCTMKKRGFWALSVDPLYKFSANEIYSQIEQTYDEILYQTRLYKNDYVWNEIGSVEELGNLRMSAMLAFLNDFDEGKKEGRYVAAELPALPFIGNSFELVLSSHFLFLYTDHVSLDLHKSSIEELCRVASEVRIFPLLDISGVISPYVDPVVEGLRQQRKLVDIETVPYEFQRGGNKMLRIRSI